MSRKQTLWLVAVGAVLLIALLVLPRASRERGAQDPKTTKTEAPIEPAAAPAPTQPKSAAPATGPVTLASTFVQPSADPLPPPARILDLSRVDTGPVITAEARVTLPAPNGCRAVRSDGECQDPLPGDADRDGHPTAEDCDDTLGQVHPGASEVRCNQLDEDCDGSDLCPPDDDGDRVYADEDCDDTSAARSPHAVEVPCNGVDEDCSGHDACDRDGDGDPAHNDCDDTTVAIYTGAKDFACDGIDQDCDGTDCCEYDADGDGHPCRTDCDDHNPKSYPGAPRREGSNARDYNCDGRPDGSGSEPALP